MRRALVLAVLVAAWAGGCSLAREPAPGGAHPPGWATRGAPTFHADWLKSNGFPLDRCATCHGADFAGGAVGSSCNSASCHASSPAACTTCHGTSKGPMPATGAHPAHEGLCADCHTVPSSWDTENHIHAKGVVQFAGLAKANGAMPSYDASTHTCSGAWCHQTKTTPPWTEPQKLGCDGCHAAPPESHVVFGASGKACEHCHPKPPGAAHVDGIVDLAPASGCTTCHGQGPLGAPPPALDGSSDPTTRGAGAHRRHLDAALGDRIGKVVDCVTCHEVPASVAVGSHPKLSGHADVRFVDGVSTYDVATGTCVVGCHFSKSPGPTWTDASGAARACDACHGFPPEKTRKGTVHPSVEPSLDACQGCHLFDPTTHVDGKVDLRL